MALACAICGRFFFASTSFNQPTNFGERVHLTTQAQLCLCAPLPGLVSILLALIVLKQLCAMEEVQSVLSTAVSESLLGLEEFVQASRSLNSEL